MTRRARINKAAAPRARERARREPVASMVVHPPDYVFRILDVIRLIPNGKVCTYGRVADASGLPGRARLVGHVLRDSPLAGSVPWHRVVGAGGRISARPGDGPDEQRRRLLKEGVAVSVFGAVKLIDHLWVPEASRLKRLSARTSHGR